MPEFNFAEVAESMGATADDIVNLLSVAKSLPMLRLTISKRELAAQIGQELQRLQSEFEELQRRAEAEEA